MNTYHGKTIEHWKNNAEEDYFTTPISVLKYITVLEEQVKKIDKEQSNYKTNTQPNFDFISGYKAAEKELFTEDDLIKGIEMALTPIDYEVYPKIDEIIEQLKQYKTK